MNMLQLIFCFAMCFTAALTTDVLFMWCRQRGIVKHYFDKYTKQAFSTEKFKANNTFDDFFKEQRRKKTILAVILLALLIIASFIEY